MTNHTGGRREFVKSMLALTGLFSLTTPGCVSATGHPSPERAAETHTSAESPNQSDRPNVLLILADDLGWSDLGCYGGEISTPNLDALASSGLRFTQTYNSARCCPSRASLLTGLYPHQAGVPDMTTPLNDRCVTLAEVLGEAGYRTYMAGKWHLTSQVTPVMRGFHEFYGMLGGFNSYWQENPYFSRLPADRPKRTYAPGSFYSTNAIGDYALDFMNDGQKSGKPWFLYLAFNAPHFPLHAPEDVIQKYEAMYREKGWDTIRAERLARQKKLGLAPNNLELTPRGITPENWINKQTGWADKEIPAWDSLPADRRGDLARRMAVYAAAAEVMDRNIGRVMNQLKETGQWENTLIFFLSDNGACAEWDPYGFDQLDSPKNKVHTGDELKKLGRPESYISYGSGWANACNTPLRLFKHYAEEGGIRTPLIVHWPKGLKTRDGSLTEQVVCLPDFMPTLVELCGAKYPTERNSVPIPPTEGMSLVPTFLGQKPKSRTIFVEHEGNRMVREGEWKLVALHDMPWQLYNLASDPTEMKELAAREPDRVKKLGKIWEEWAMRCKVVTSPAPQIANSPLQIRCVVTPAPDGKDGVILAQGGDQRGYALYLRDGKPVFAVREAGKLTEIAATEAPKRKFVVEARLALGGVMMLSVDGKTVATGKAPGLISAQPKDGLSIGEDTASAVGNYRAPHPFRGKVENVTVDTNAGS